MYFLVLNGICFPENIQRLIPGSHQDTVAYLNLSAYLRKKLLICFLMNARSPRNFPYILWRTVFRKSRSLGSSLSKSSKSWRTNFWSMTFLPMLGWKSGDSRKRKKNSYTSWKIKAKFIHIFICLNSAVFATENL